MLADAHEGWCAHDLRLERTLLRAADALDAAAIPFLLIKGPAIAHRWYPDPSQRLFADLDLVVPGRSIRPASELLSRGARRDRRRPSCVPASTSASARRRCCAAAPTPSLPTGLEIDVHRTPGRRRARPGHPARRALRRGRARSSSTAGRSPPPDRWPPCCSPATRPRSPTSRPASRRWRDVVQMLDAGEAPPDEVIAAAARWQATAVRGRGGAPRGRAARPGLPIPGSRPDPLVELGRVHDARPSLADAAGRPSASGVRVLAPAGRRRRPVGLAGPRRLRAGARVTPARVPVRAPMELDGPRAPGVANAHRSGAPPAGGRGTTRPSTPGPTRLTS